jgi:O-acetyl-ADP-ribose deacetylase (regulator of RNase III)
LYYEVLNRSSPDELDNHDRAHHLRADLLGPPYVVLAPELLLVPRPAAATLRLRSHRSDSKRSKLRASVAIEPLGRSVNPSGGLARWYPRASMIQLVFLMFGVAMAACLGFAVIYQPEHRARRSAPMNETDELRRLLEAEGPEPGPIARRRLRELLTLLPPGAIPADAWPRLDALWALEARRRVTTSAASLPRLGPQGWAARVSRWRGDVTTLEIDAIVNAANPGLTGCYRPFHRCVDNAIHTAAGPRLREECGAIMAGRGQPEPTATATVTGGWFLPARYVVHTVGPVVEGGAPTPGDARALARCYTACLEAAAGPPGVRGVAFCGISTGLYGFPVEEAAPLAIAAVAELLEHDRRLDLVVFVTFTDLDDAVYAARLAEALHAT